MATLTSTSKTSNCAIEYVTAADTTTSTSYVDATASTLTIPDGVSGAIYARVNAAAANTCFLRLTDTATGTATYLEVQTATGAGTFNVFGVFTNTTGGTITAKLQFRSSAGGSVTIQRSVDNRSAIFSGSGILYCPDTTERNINMKIFSTDIEFIGFYPQDDNGEFILNGGYHQQDGANENETVTSIGSNNAITAMNYQSLTNADGIIVFDWNGIDLNVTV